MSRNDEADAQDDDQIEMTRKLLGINEFYARAGGLAFPFVITDGQAKTFHFGATLRDLYAMAALAGIAAHRAGPKSLEGETSTEAHARWAFGLADEMLKRRAK